MAVASVLVLSIGPEKCSAEILPICTSIPTPSVALGIFNSQKNTHALEKGGGTETQRAIGIYPRSVTVSTLRSISAQVEQRDLYPYWWETTLVSPCYPSFTSEGCQPWYFKAYSLSTRTEGLGWTSPLAREAPGKQHQCSIERG